MTQLYATGTTFFERYREAMLFLARCSVLVLLYGVAASMALASLATVLILFFWLLSGDAVRAWPRLKTLPAFWPLLLLPLMVLVGTAYSVAPTEYAYRYFRVYSRFLIVLIIVALITDPVWQKRCWRSFLLGAAVALVSTYLSVFWVPPWSGYGQTGLGVNHSVFYDYIAQGVMTSFLAVLALSQVLTRDTRREKLVWALVLALAVFSITHLLIGRTGQVVVLVALAGVLLLALPARLSLPLLAGLLILVLVLAVTSPVLGERFGLILSEMDSFYRAGEVKTSIGARLSMWITSFQFFLDQPLWGHGTGAYRWLAEQVYTDPEVCQVNCVHPHNQFLFFGVEHGVVGMALYGWLLFAVAQTQRSVTRVHALMLGGFLCIVTVDSFINSPFWISSERNFYTAILGLLLSSHYLNARQPQAHRG